MYALNGIPRDILHRAKVHARERGERLDDLVVRFITSYSQSDSEAVVTACGAQPTDRYADAPPPD